MKEKGLDIIIMDDDIDVCETLKDNIIKFYKWGEILSFSDVDEAISYCLTRDIGIAIFVIDTFLGVKTGFYFLDALEETFPHIYEDTVMITGHASDDVVNTCVTSGINHLLEKPIKEYALQFSIRTIVEKYLSFAKKLIQNPELADSISQL
jgi:response regulator of citrate/malate metabolism